jgi:tetratricopeptide (TPR) repeat protein
MLVLTQALWFSLPVAFSYMGLRTGIDPIDSYFRNQNYVFLVALGHAVQYLWITTYYARMSSGWGGYAPYLGKIFVSGVTIWTLPLLLFSVDLLGPAAYASGLAVLMGSAVNVHHFILDGAIWKLRDGPIARVLIRQPVPDETSAIRPESGVSWIRRGAWAFLVCWVLLQALSIAEYEYGARLAMRSRPIDIDRLATSVERLRWIGSDDADLRFQLGAAAGERGDLAMARREFERSNALQANPKATIGLAFVAAQEGQHDEARGLLARAVEETPENPDVWSRASKVWRVLGDIGRADAALARAAALNSGGQDPSGGEPGRSARNM